MRRPLIAILAVSLALSGIFARPMGMSGDARQRAGSSGDEASSIAAADQALVSPTGSKTSPLPLLLMGAIDPPSPRLAPPRSDARIPSGPDWLPVGSARRHAWLQRFRC